MRTRWLFPVLLFAFWPGGCSDGAAPIPFGEYCDQYTGFACSTANRCDCLGGVSEELCRTYLRPDCEEEIEEPVLSGTMAYDMAAAGRCLDGLKAIAADCSTDGDREPDACDEMLVGQRAAGDFCESDDECSPGLECYYNVCTGLPDEGHACLEYGTCASGHFCGADGLCHPYRGSGESCAEQAVCDEDLYCDERTVTCEPYLGSGQSCAHASWACGDDLYCSDLTDSCQTYPGEGGDCADSHGTCADDFYCGPEQTCLEQKPGGDDCTASEECLSYECEGGTCAQEENSICSHW